MKILHYKKTLIAYAPDILVDCINKYSGKEYYAELNTNLNYDILHFHNHTNGLPYNDKQIIQYHSEPGPRVDLKFKGIKLVLAPQYHCTLDEYKDCKWVRNVIDLKAIQPNKDKKINYLKVGYSPSTTKNVNKYFDKGYEATKNILEGMKRDFPRRFDYDIINGVSLEECLRRKNECNVIIDECVTGCGFHRSALEGLAMGKLTVCYINNSIVQAFKKYSPVLPVSNVPIQNLRDFLEYQIDRIEYVYHVGKMSRAWMEECWNMENIIEEYINIYKEVL